MLENTPTQSTMTELLGQPLFAVWQELCSAIDEKYDMERLWNTGGKNWVYEYKYRRGGKTLCSLYAKKNSLGFRGCLLQSESLFWHLSYPVCDTAHLKGDNYNEKQNFNCDFYHYALCPVDDPATAYL